MKITDRVSSLIYVIIIFLVLIFSNIAAVQAGAEGVTVFIIDSNIEEKYLSDNPKIDAETGHGSLVAWIISRETDNYDINIIPLDVTGGNEKIEYDLYLSALREITDYKLTHPCQKILVNISLGFQDRTGYNYIKDLYEKGVQVIAAAGNNNSQQPVYPAGFSREVIAVASASSHGKAESSNYGYYIDISAPGSLKYIESLYFPGQRLNRKFEYSGTSFASPRVTALLAVLLTSQNELTIGQAVEIMKETALAIDEPLYEKNMLGAGIINKERALASVIENYTLYKYLKITVIAVFVGLILLILWPRYKIFSIFVFLLLLIVFFPVGILIKENIGFLLAEGRYYLYYLAAGVIFFFIVEKIMISIVKKMDKAESVIKLLFLPFPALRKDVEKRLIVITDNNKDEARFLQQKLLKIENNSKKKILIRVLSQIGNPPLKLLLDYAINNWYLADFIVTSISDLNNKEKLINILLKYLNIDSYTAQKLTEKTCRKLNPELVLPKLLPLLKEDFQGNKEVILRILESYSGEASSVVEDVKKILLESEDMWIRYQAVKTLFSISVDKEMMTDYLKTYRDDEQELVRMEVRELLKEKNYQ